MDAENFEMEEAEPPTAQVLRQPAGAAGLPARTTSVLPTPPEEVIGQGADLEPPPRTPPKPQDVTPQRQHSQNGVRTSLHASHGREMPASEEAEQHVIACCLIEAGTSLQRAVQSGLVPESFYWPQHQMLFAAAMKLQAKGVGPTVETLPEEMGQSAFDQAGGFPMLMQVTGKVPTEVHAGYFIEKVLELAEKRQLIRNATGLVESAYNGEDLAHLRTLAGHLTPQPAKPKQDPFSRRVRFASPPPEPTTRLFLAKKPVATPGNLQTIISRAKTGKTAALGGAVAAIIAAHHDRQGQDCLGFSAPHTDEAVVLIDTEQAPYDAWTCHQRTLARANSPDPDWLLHHALVGYSCTDLRQSLPLILEAARTAHKGIFTVILDGVADFVPSVNDEVACNEFISWLRSLAIDYNTPIICVIHSNEGVKTGDDGRGWLGKELTRKAESNLLLKKVGEITTITSEKQRKAPITEADQVAFQWSDEQQRHVSCATATPKKAGGRARLHTIQEFMDVIPLKGTQGRTGSQLHRQANDMKEIKLQTFKDLLADAVKDGILARTYDDKTGFSYTRAL